LSSRPERSAASAVEGPAVRGRHDTKAIGERCGICIPAQPAQRKAGSSTTLRSGRDDRAFFGRVKTRMFWSLPYYEIQDRVSSRTPLVIPHPPCHPDRSEAQRAQWRELLFGAGTIRKLLVSAAVYAFPLNQRSAKQVPPLRFAPVGMTRVYLWTG